jgi:hypothetical protein
MSDNKYREVSEETALTFPISIRSKMLLTVGTLLVSTLAAPAAHFRGDRIREIQATATLPEAMSMFAGLVILIGNVSTFFVGVYMLKHVRDRATASSATRAKIEKQLRIEDFVMYWQVLGTVAVFVPLVPIVLAGLFPGIIEPMYDAGITIYRPFETFTIDIRLVAGVTGGGFGVLLGAMWWLVRE